MAVPCAYSVTAARQMEAYQSETALLLGLLKG